MCACAAAEEGGTDGTALFINDRKNFFWIYDFMTFILTFNMTIESNNLFLTKLFQLFHFLPICKRSFLLQL
jgi:hypothetical protein